MKQRKRLCCILKLRVGNRFLFFLSFNSKRENEFWKPHSLLWGEVNVEAFILILINNPIKPPQKRMLSLFYWSAKALLIPPLKLWRLLLTHYAERCRARGCQILDTIIIIQPELRSAHSAHGAPSVFFLFFFHANKCNIQILYCSSFWCGHPATTTNHKVALHTECSCAFIHHLPWTCTNESILSLSVCNIDQSMYIGGVDCVKRTAYVVTNLVRTWSKKNALGRKRGSIIYWSRGNSFCIETFKFE